MRYAAQHPFVALVAVVLIPASLTASGQEVVAPAAAQAADAPGAVAPVIPPIPPQGEVDAVEQQAPEVLEKGPVHEAFAEPVVLAQGERVTVERAPPDPVNEIPPQVRPEGANVEWISGYWMWSDLQHDFIWVSGVWREVPPGRRWVPGHWGKVDGGFEWTPGFWAAEQAEEVQVLPNPPETLEVGPSSPAPAANYFWVPGIWVWQNGGYGWRAGYWYAGQDNWLWVPDRYCYTPRGAIFVSGYWDYPLVNRGLLYAPVYWSRPWYANPGYVYRPYRLVNTALLLTALFVNNHHHHYYYGWGGWGNNFYRPWWSNHWGHGHGYDPFYSYHRWHDGHNHDDWHNHVRRDWDRHHGHDGRGDQGPRPGGGGGRPAPERLVQDVGEFRRNQVGKPGSVHVRDVTPAEAQAALRKADDWKQIRNARIAADGAAQANVGGNRRNGSPADSVARAGSRQGKPGDMKGQGAAAGAGDGPKLRVDAPEGAPRAAFRLPPAQAGGHAGRATGSTQAQRATRAWQTNPAGSQGNVVQSQPGGSGGAVRNGRPTFQQGGRAAVGDASVGATRGANVPQLHGGSGRSFRYDGGSAVGRSSSGGGQTAPSFQGGGHQASGGMPRQVEQRSLRVPSSGGQRSFSVPSGGGSTYRGSTGGGQHFRSSGGGQQIRGGGGGQMRSGGGGGGQQFRGGGGGGGGSRNSGGGGGGRGRGR